MSKPLAETLIGWLAVAAAAAFAQMLLSAMAGWVIMIALGAIANESGRPDSRSGSGRAWRSGSGRSG